MRIVDRDYLDIEPYINECISTGYLTDEYIRRYPLKLFSLYAYIKIYCRVKHLSFKIKYVDVPNRFADKYYITDIGLQMFYKFIRTHKIKFLRNYFGYMLEPLRVRISVTCPETHLIFGNYRGESGNPIKQGIKKPGRIREFTNPLHTKYIDKVFPTLYEAREYLRLRLMYKPPEYFEVYVQRDHKHYDINKKGERIMRIETIWRKLNVIIKPRSERHVFTPEQIQKGFEKIRAIQLAEQRWAEEHEEYLRSL